MPGGGTDRESGRGPAGAGLGRGRRGRAVARAPHRADRRCQAFRGTLATKVIICKPADPEAKGLVERFHDYLERAFLPGRSFTSPGDFNAQLQGLLGRANTRQHRALGCRPVDRIDADRTGMLTLPPVPPVVGWGQETRLPRDHYVRLDGNDYSVHPVAVGRRIHVSADLHRVQVTCDGRLVADHERVWANHQTICDPEHVTAARALRRERLEIVPPATEAQVEQRHLGDYDTALGLDGTVA